MAKYDITYSCGHTGVAELFGKEKDRQSKIQWYENNGLCPECYKKKMMEKKSQMPLTINAVLDLTVAKDNLLFYFSGNTTPVKETIRELGYRWSDLYVGFKGLISAEKPDMGWQKHISINDLDNEIDRVYSAFPEVEAKINISQIDLMCVKEKEEAKERNKQDYEKEVSELTKPVKPECYPTERWNEKVYGSEKNGYRIFLNGNAVAVSPSEKEQLAKYISERDEYNNRVREIKRKYNMV